jgi:Ni,Fe-hydrogenase I small subunit
MPPFKPSFPNPVAGVRRLNYGTDLFPDLTTPNGQCVPRTRLSLGDGTGYFKLNEPFRLHHSTSFSPLARSSIPASRFFSMKLSVNGNEYAKCYVLAIGTCSAYGGIISAGENVTEACGLQFDGDQEGGLLGKDFRAASGLPVINVAGCPTHPGWIVDTLLSLALGALAESDLDAWQRPRFYTEQLVHHGCPRNEFYEFKASAQKLSDLGCLMENMGCKGTQANADCNLRLWHGVGSCVRGGFACISCTEPGFEEPGHPFMETAKIAGIPTGLPVDMPKAWFVALAALSKSATPKRVRENSRSDHPLIAPGIRKSGQK